MRGYLMSELTVQQRRTPPEGHDGQPRLRRSRGGRPPLPTIAIDQAGMDNELARYPGTVFDTEIRRDRTAWYPRDYYSMPGISWISWTQAGPPRPELAMRNVTVRSMVGNSQARAFADPINPQRGLHTNPTPGVARTVERYVSGNPQMTPGRQDRLTRQKYAGQSYSQTTTMQGAGGRGR